MQVLFLLGWVYPKLYPKKIPLRKSDPPFTSQIYIDRVQEVAKHGVHIPRAATS